ncbi:glycine zipper 2TM domain-containing protein [Chitiniphilus purpureus]|uniref:Glycine zipper 2TM domain-containing protein n=1 Tax=Chitiniphilus purpureus TaxID=2981137 RepID=A0ABY6DIL0_9NEIS|nr:glycine zipper 2TM domain-containing protein [Chitiniphilus sp. CD1]UXY14182.1 glycine zipper 2TM domain-containing protein [Chitiniphilus sp. CD1]
MKHVWAKSAGALLLLAALTGCSSMDKQTRNTAAGAAIGGAAGAILTNGSAVGTVGGAAVGGVIGHETTKD